MLQFWLGYTTFQLYIFPISVWCKEYVSVSIGNCPSTDVILGATSTCPLQHIKLNHNDCSYIALLKVKHILVFSMIPNWIAFCYGQISIQIATQSLGIHQNAKSVKEISKTIWLFFVEHVFTWYNLQVPAVIIINQYTWSKHEAILGGRGNLNSDKNNFKHPWKPWCPDPFPFPGYYRSKSLTWNIHAHKVAMF